MNAIKITIVWLFVAIFFGAGLAHFILVDEWVKIVPPFIPFPKGAVYVTGLMEIGLALGLALPGWRRFTGMATAAYCLLVLPANIWQAIAKIEIFGSVPPDAALWARIPMQFVIIALVLWATRGGQTRGPVKENPAGA